MSLHLELKIIRCLTPGRPIPFRTRSETFGAVGLIFIPTAFPQNKRWLPCSRKPRAVVDWGWIDYGDMDVISAMIALLRVTRKLYEQLLRLVLRQGNMFHAVCSNSLDFSTAAFRRNAQTKGWDGRTSKICADATKHKRGCIEHSQAIEAIGILCVSRVGSWWNRLRMLHVQHHRLVAERLMQGRLGIWRLASFLWW